jgi:mRNA-degrading endonuclease RelE of RelBE toxin-antitoxin system
MKARIAVFSRTAINENLAVLLAAGAKHYSQDFLELQRKRVFAAVRSRLLDMPEAYRVDPAIGLRTMQVKHTPFRLAYDFDDTQVRVHVIFHRHANRETIDITSIDW